ncbi:MAG: gliding motility-associated C-terminal domain-containing protein, partial [Saprospiraceae bacterium]
TLCFGEDTIIAGTIIDASNPIDTIIIDGGSYTGCDSTVFVNMSFYEEAVENIEFTLCFGQSIVVNGTVYDQNSPTGTEELPGESYTGCDSTININLSFNNAVEVAITETFCDPTETVIVNGNTYDIDNTMGIDTMLSVSGCDSIVTTTLTYPDSVFVFFNDVLCPGDELLVNGVTYDESMPDGTEVEIGASPDGCNIYNIIDLSFYDISESTMNETLCDGQDILIEGVLFDVNNTSDTIVLPGAAFNGCDSFLIVNIDFFPEIITTIDSSLCDEQFILVNGNTYDIDTPTGTEVMTAANGCDSTINVMLTFGGAVVSEETETLCEGGEIIINGTLYNADNVMGSDTFPEGSFTGCDSIVNINIVFLPNSINVIDTMLCIGEDLIINNITYNNNNLSGMDTLFGANHLGCDSILDVTISYFLLSENTIDTTLCDGESFVWNNVTYPPTETMVTDVIAGGSFTGCDSTLTINISHYAPAIFILDTMLCLGEELELHGTIFNEDNLSGDVLLEGESATGCDSTISVTLGYYLLAASSESMTICEGDTIFWNGQSLTTTGIYEELLIGQSYQGCDSTDIMDLTVVSPSDLGFANAGNDLIICGESISLSANQPANTNGSWIILEGSATFEDPTSATTQLNDMSHDSLVLVWSLSNDICPNYDEDTITIMTGIIPDALDDEYVGEEGMLEVRLSILENDDFEDIDAWYYNILDLPAGELTNQGDGQYNYLAPIDSLGKMITFDYELCNEDCPDVCDTATVRIQLIEAVLQDFPNTITVNGDGVNDFFVIPDIEDQPDQFNKQELIIFNRWGDVVYTAKPYQNDWGGTNQSGNELPQGTYYYVLRLDIGAGIIYRGDITILK